MRSEELVANFIFHPSSFPLHLLSPDLLKEPTYDFDADLSTLNYLAMLSLPSGSLRVVRWVTIAATTVVMISNQCTVERTIAAEPPKPLLPANLREVNIWTRALGTAKMPAPWRVAPCDSNSKAPLLCVYERETLVGTVEMGTFLISSRTDLRKKLTEAGIPAQAYTDPKYRSRVATALKAWVEDYYTFFKKDREADYGNTITFTAQPPAQVTIGKLTGLRYGFAGVRKNNSIHERHIGYVAFDGSMLYVITTAFDAMSETGKFKTLEDFQRFEPYLAKLLPRLQLPIASRSNR